MTQPDRLPTDGPVSVTMDGPDHLLLSVECSTVRVSRYNAFRVFGMLAFMLGIELPSRIAKSIKL